MFIHHYNKVTRHLCFVFICIFICEIDIVENFCAAIASSFLLCPIIQNLPNIMYKLSKPQIYKLIQMFQYSVKIVMNSINSRKKDIEKKKHRTWTLIGLREQTALPNHFPYMTYYYFFAFFLFH